MEESITQCPKDVLKFNSFHFDLLLVWIHCRAIMSPARGVSGRRAGSCSPALMSDVCSSGDLIVTRLLTRSSVVRKLHDFEAPFISLRTAGHSPEHRIVLRKKLVSSFGRRAGVGRTLA